MTRDEFLREVIDREPMLEALADGPVTRSELVDRFDTSSTTVHRVLTSFRENGLARELEEGYVLTPLGQRIEDASVRFRSTVRTARRLEPLLEAVEPTEFTLDIDDFADASVTVSTPRRPYHPVARLSELFSDGKTLRGMYRIAPNPMYVDRLFDGIVENETVEVIYDRSTATGMIDGFPEKARRGFREEDVTLYLCDGIPFGLSIFDDRAAIATYDADSGILSTLIETADPDAVQWAERVYAAHRNDAEPVEELADLPAE